MRPHRALYLDVTAGLLRFATGCAYGLVALQPDGSKYVLFCLLVAGGLALEVPRIIYAATVLRRASSDAAREHQLKRQHHLELLQQQALEAELELKRKHEEAEEAAKLAAEEAAREALNAPLLVFPVPTLHTRPLSADAEAAHHTATATAAYAAAESLYGPHDPKYLREASKIKPRLNAVGDEARLSLRPSWVPTTRPMVRTHNQPDLPLPAFFRSDGNVVNAQPMVPDSDALF